MKPAAIIPYRPEDAERMANWERTRQQWEAIGWPVYIGDHEGDLFSRAKAINDGARQAVDADVLCIADVDFLFSRPDQAVDAAEVALAQGAHVVPFSTLHILGPESTQLVRDGADPGSVPILESVGMVWICAIVIPRDLFELVHGFDERFIGYGEEDLGFMATTGTMGKKMRVFGTAYHLTHSEPFKDHPHRQANRDLCSRYRGADGDKDAIMAIIKERS